MQPLDDIRVLSLGQFMSAPYCTMLLADLGAEVIKVERPGVGDPRRTIPPYPEGTDAADRLGGGFMAYNRNKRSVVIDLRTDRGRELFTDLAAEADVVVENMKPGSADRLGVGYEALSAVNPQLVYAAISGFGQLEGYRGPYTERPALDIVVEAMSGIMQQVGFEDRPPQWTLYGLADLYSGLVTAFSILTALHMRERTGEGQFVDTSMYDAMLSLNERMVMLYSFTGEMQPRGHMRHQGPQGAFEAADGYVAVNIPNDPMWARLCEVVGREDLVEDERTATGPARAEHRAFVRTVLEDWLADRPKAAAVEVLNDHGVPAGVVQTAAEVFADEQVAARGMLVDVEDPELGPHTFARTPTRLSAAPEIDAVPAPRLGEHTRSVLGDLLGLSDADVDALVADGVVATGSE